MDTTPTQQHEDVYEAVFALVGQKPNETYEALAKVLPTIKNVDPAELKELEAMKQLREMMKPSVDPLREEYEKAGEEDVDDLSTEDGDWLDRRKEDDEELDENGIPIMKLSRASSGFILDGPGDVKVDNFTPEGDVPHELAGEGADGNAAPTPPLMRAATATEAATDAPYIPSAFERARRESGTGTKLTTTTAPAHVLALEDAIRALQAPRVTASGAISPSRNQVVNRRPLQQQQQQQDGDEEAEAQEPSPAVGDDEDDEATEALPEPQGALLPRSRVGGAGHGHGHGHSTGGGASSLGAGRPAPPGTVLSGGFDCVTAVAVAAAALGTDDEMTCALPGTCLDTRHEDSLWEALQGVDGRALLEDLGLAGSSPLISVAPNEDPGAEGGSSTGRGQDQVQREGMDEGSSVPPAAETSSIRGSMNGHGREGAALANGHPREVKGAVPVRLGTRVNDVSSSSRHVHASGSSGDGSAADGALGPAAVTAAGAAPVATAAVGNKSNGEATAGQLAVIDAAATRAVHRPHQSTLASSSGDGPTFEEVEAFSLDPDFDYDNAPLTVREFPYSMLRPGALR